MTEIGESLARPTDRSGVVDAIDKVIAVRSNIASADGLTVSTLSFGGASLLWFLVSGAGGSSGSVVGVLRLYVLSFVAAQLLKAAWYLVNEAGSGRPFGRPTLLAVWVRRLTYGPTFLVNAIHGAGASLVVLTCFDIHVGLRWALAVSFFMSVLNFAHAFWPVATAGWVVEGKTNGHYSNKGIALLTVLLLIVIAVGGLALYGSYAAGRKYGMSFTVHQVQIVLAIWALMLVLRKFSSRIGEFNILQNLAAIRDEVAFDMCEPEDGLARVRIMTVGGNAAELVRPEIESVARSMASMRKALRTFVAFANATAEAFDETTESSVKADVIWKKSGFGLDRINEVSNEIKEGQEVFKKLESRLIQKARVAYWAFGESNDSIRLVLEEFDRQRDKMKNELEEFGPAFENLKNVMAKRKAANSSSEPNGS